MPPKRRRLVGTGAAADAVGVDPATLWRWEQAGRVQPEMRTAGGQARWDIDVLRRQLQAAAPAPTEELPTTPEPQPVVAAVVTSDRGVLVARRHDGRPLWTLIAGEVEPGESSADAAIREVKEETGLRVAYSRIIGRRVHPHTKRLMIYLACTPMEGTDVVVGDPDELAEVRWATFDEAVELLPGLYEPVRDHLDAALSPPR